MDKVKGSMEVLSDMQITADTTGMDAHSKIILRNKEVLAIILGEVIAEYKGYTRKEVYFRIYRLGKGFLCNSRSALRG